MTKLSFDEFFNMFCIPVNLTKYHGVWNNLLKMIRFSYVKIMNNNSTVEIEYVKINETIKKTIDFSKRYDEAIEMCDDEELKDKLNVAFNNLQFTMCDILILRIKGFMKYAEFREESINKSIEIVRRNYEEKIALANADDVNRINNLYDRVILELCLAKDNLSDLEFVFKVRNFTFSSLDEYMVLKNKTNIYVLKTKENFVNGDINSYPWIIKIIDGDAIGVTILGFLNGKYSYSKIGYDDLNLAYEPIDSFLERKNNMGVFTNGVINIWFGEGIHVDKIYKPDTNKKIGKALVRNKVISMMEQ